MPNCFQLISKADHEAGATSFNQIDEALCAHFGVPADPRKWLCEWYNDIGLRLAMGSSFDEIIEKFTREEEGDGRPFYGDLVGRKVSALQIAQYLNDHYTANAWSER